MSGFCKKCQMRFEGSTCPICHSVKENNAKKAASGVVITGIVLMLGILLYTGGIQIDGENLAESIQVIPQKSQEASESVKDIATETSTILRERINEQLDNTGLEPTDSSVDDITTNPKTPLSEAIKRINQVQTEIQKITSPQLSTEEDAIKSIKYINQIRAQNGKTPISHDSRVYLLALERSKDMYEYDYFDHTNPETGTCPFNLKSNFGLLSSENVAENVYMITSNGIPTLYNPSLYKAVDAWMDSTGHRINLLSYQHVSGSTACYGGYCTFLGLNHGTYGGQCSTAAEGKKSILRFDACTLEQMNQFDSLHQRHGVLGKEYDKFPQTITSQSEYQQAMNMYDELQTIYSQMENFRC